MVGEPATRLPLSNTRVRSEPRPRRPTVDWDWKELPEEGYAAEGVVGGLFQVICHGLLTGLFDLGFGDRDNRGGTFHVDARDTGAGDLDLLSFSTF